MVVRPGSTQLSGFEVRFLVSGPAARGHAPAAAGCRPRAEHPRRQPAAIDADADAIAATAAVAQPAAAVAVAAVAQPAAAVAVASAAVTVAATAVAKPTAAVSVAATAVAKPTAAVSSPRIHY